MQTKVAKYVTNSINEDFGTNLLIKKVDLSFLGTVKFKGIEIRDHHKDTLIFVKKLNTSILNIKKVIEGDVNLKSISLEDAFYYTKTYKGETKSNMGIFIDSFDTDKPKDSITKPFFLTTPNIYVSNLNYRLINENNKNPITYKASKIGGNLQDFSVKGSNVTAKIRGLYFTEYFGFNVTNFTTDFEYANTAMIFDKTTLQTRTSKVVGDIFFNYKKNELANFNDKVKIKASFRKSALSVKDLKKLYNQLEGNDVFNFTGNVTGTINNLNTQNLNLNSTNGLKVYGNLAFQNSAARNRGFIFDGDIQRFTATYKDLKRLLPNVLGKTLPAEFSKLGKFTLRGPVKVTPEKVDATITVNTEIGSLLSNLQISNIDNFDYANYTGEVVFKNFQIGTFFSNNLFGNISLKGDVNGKGFALENINTSFIGEVSELEFKGYKYTNLKANGQYQNNKFDGDLSINDDNFKMKFKGLADLSSKVHKFDFDADIAYLNLQKTNLFTRDSISLLKGKIILDIEGNTFDDIVGSAIFKNILYTNQKEEFSFKEFNVASSIKDSIKKIEVTSKDIANGYLKGKFSFNELLPVAQNALGSIYTNYNPYVVEKSQFLDFNFTVYNQIVNVFFPEVFIDDKTKIKGKIVSDKNLLKLNVTSPRIEAYGNELKGINLITDNQNPLYNTSLTASALNTKYYNLSKLNLLNRTENDTLYFKSIFKGGKLNNEEFNLDFFYTINAKQKNVVGFEKSSFNFKENTWTIDPQKEITDRVVFDLKTNEFDFSKFKLVSKEQIIEFTGRLRGNTEKVLLADFTNVNLESFLPEIDSLALKGVMSGSLDFVQKEGVYSPEALVLVNDFEINNFKQGDLAINIIGDNSIEKYNVDFSIKNNDVKSIAANGEIDFSTKRPLIDLNVFLEEFSLNAFSPLGQDVLSSLRGTANGSVNLKGFLGNPEMEGTLKLKNAGLMFPYLNVDYDFDGESTITLDQQSFIFEDIKILDTKYGTRGTLQGDITHLNFKQWFMNLEIDTPNLLTLNTQDSEDAAYFGTAFFKGTAGITGLTDQLTIDINGSTEPGTVFVVPLKDVETVNSYRLIHFKSDTLKVAERQKELAEDALKGLSLNLNLNVTKDAKAQVVIDEVNGSQLTGYGSGDLQIEINTRGKFNIFGDYRIDSGVYDFKYGGIVNKPFVIQKGGTISWNGNPFDANLNVTAVYKARANPSTLLQNFNSSRNIEVDLVTKISGGLFSSKQELDIELPNVDPAIATELEFILNDNNVNEKTTQFISLLSLGSFVNPDKVNFDSTSAITSTASNAIAAAFSSLINSSDSKFKFGVDYVQGVDNSDTDRLNVDNQVDVSVSTNVSDRVIINGKVGVPVGTKTQSSVVGEVKVEILLNKEGNFRGLIFNRQNEIQYSTEEEGYTQGVGLSYQVNFNTLSELLQKVGLKKSKKKRKKSIKKDSINSKRRELINFEGN